jgi:hypothetical protein
MLKMYDSFLNSTDSFKSFLLQLRKSLMGDLIFAENYGVNLSILSSNYMSMEYLFLYTVNIHQHEGKLISIIDYLLQPIKPSFKLTKQEEKAILEKYVINTLT